MNDAAERQDTPASVRGVRSAGPPRKAYELRPTSDVLIAGYETSGVQARLPYREWFHHLYHRQGLSVTERHGKALHFHIASEPIKGYSREGRAHLEAAEARCHGFRLDMRQYQRAQALSREVWMHKDGAYFGGIGGGIENATVPPFRSPRGSVFVRAVVANGSTVGAEERFAFGPASAAGDTRLCVLIESLGDKVRPVENQLGISTPRTVPSAPSIWAGE